MQKVVFFLILAVFAGIGRAAAQAPVISDQPTNQKVLPGSTAIFSVTVSNANGPFTYQWLFDGSKLPNGVITTVAGGLFGGTATNANLNLPRGVAVDTNGNVFVADTGNNCVRKVDINGVISTVAGNGVPGFSGDGGAAVNAALNTPLGVTADRLGNVFIVDGANERIRKVDTNGIITTVAGNGSAGYSGDGGPATNAAIYTALGRNTYAEGLAVDTQGNLFIADYGNARVRKVDPEGIITTVAGNGTNGYSGDNGLATNASMDALLGVAADTNGNLFIADTGNNRIRKVNTAGIITTVAGNGTNGFSGDNGLATNATLSSPYGVAVDELGNLFIADLGNYRIRAVLTDGIITTVAGDGTNSSSGDGGQATNASLGPFGVAVDSQDNLLIADYAGSRVRKVNDSGSISTLAGNGTTGYAGNGVPATNASLDLPDTVAVDTNGNLVIADTGNNRIRKVDSSGIITTVAGNGTNSYFGDGGAATNASLADPFAVAEDTQGNLFISDSGNSRIRKVDTNGTITTVAGNGTNGFSGDNGPATNASLYSPYGVAVDSNANLFIADYNNNRVREVMVGGIIKTVAGNGSESFSGDNDAATNAGLIFPEGLGVDGPGNLYIGEPINTVERVRKVNTSGIITSVAGNGTNGYSGDGGAATNAELYQPEGVGVDGEGNFYIADAVNNRIRKVDTNGIITTVAGNGTYGFAGDGGPATNANLAAPFGVTFDANGDMFIADTENNRIREVTPPGGSPALTLNNVGTNNAGDYQVIVTGSHGSTTSSVATLTIVGPQTFLFTGVTASNFNFTWSAVVGQLYQIQYNSDLDSNTWTNLGGSVRATNSTMESSDIISTNGRRYYRIELPAER